jgi:uncharacterized protein (DUF362 family)
MAWLIVAVAMGACTTSGHEPRQPNAPGPSAPPAAPAPAASSSAANDPKPDIHSGASVLDTGPLTKLVTDGSIDGAALRRKNLEKLRSTRWPVMVVSGGKAAELGEKLCEAVVPRRPATTPVLLKPNLCGFHALKRTTSPEDDDGVRGRITDPEFVRGVVRCLKKRGHTRITIAEGCGVGHSVWTTLIEKSGYRALAESEGVPLVGMNDDGVFDARGDKPGKPLRVLGMEKTNVPTLLLPKVLAEHLDHGLFLSLPKVKAHRYSVVSLGIKGMQGVVMRSDRAPAHQQKWRMHTELHTYLKTRDSGREDRKAYVSSLERFGERLLDVLEVAMPDAVLCDGAPAMRGDGFDLLVPSETAYAIGGTNPVAVDKVGAQLLGLWNNDALGKELGGYKSSPLILMAAARYGLDLDRVELTGNGAQLVAKPPPAVFRAIAPFAIGAGASEERR